MATALAILKAITAAWSVYRHERDIFNKPEMVQAKLAAQSQEVEDRLRAANAISANEHATPAEHAAALRSIRLAHS